MGGGGHRHLETSVYIKTAVTWETEKRHNATMNVMPDGEERRPRGVAGAAGGARAVGRTG